MKKILLLSAHTDDVEMGCGGSVARFIEEGNDIYSVAFSIAEKSLPAGLPKDTLLYEAKASAEILGIKSQNLLIYKYPVREFPKFRQEILEDLVGLNKRIQPDLVLLPSRHDSHQDHHTIAMEGCRAFKSISVLSYEIVWNNVFFEATSFIFLKERHVKKKLDALKCYKSQVLRLKQLGKTPIDSRHVKALMEVRGSQIGADYAEAFNVVRWIIK